MCGIAGLASAGGPVDAPAVERACNALRHRGPDDSGTLTLPGGRCVLGNRRLAVLDLSPAGHMPMSTPDGRFHITYNGEIYNFRELRRELERRGHRFVSGGDTEVLLHLYAEHGPNAVERLNGMFALAIWDKGERTLFLARDRMGIKPLYFARLPDGLVFASEVRALLATGIVERRLNLAAAAGFLSLGSVPDDATIIAGVESLPPGHTALWQEGNLRLHRYWSHADSLHSARPLPASEVAGTVRETLRAAVARQLVSDAPLGLFLSGGMDSSTLAALAAASGARELTSVSIGFDRPDDDETARARRVAGRFGLRHHECRVGEDAIHDSLGKIVDSMDQPTIDGVNVFLVSRAAREAGLTVALAGTGGDELFGGYSTFTLVPRLQRLMTLAARVPGHDRLARAAVAAPAIPYRARKLAFWMNGNASLPASYAAVRGLLPPDDVAALLRDRVVPDPIGYLDSAVEIEGLPAASAVSLLESRIYMHNQLLRDTDAMSMAHSLEVRVPFLDDEVIALAARCQATLAGANKPALAAARAAYFPAGEAPPAKQGFNVPWPRWLRGPLGRQSEELTRSTALFDTAAVGRLWTEFRAGRRHASAVWAPAVLALWCRRQGMAEG